MKSKVTINRVRIHFVGVLAFLLHCSIAVYVSADPKPDCDGSGGTCDLDCKKFTAVTYIGCIRASVSKTGPGTSLISDANDTCGRSGVGVQSDCSDLTEIEDDCGTGVSYVCNNPTLGE